MGEYGFDVLPYYEYSGSKGYKGLGNQRRAKPLTRDDAYTHITWIESANADITDPDTFEDFKKMLDLTVLRMRGKAHFAGVWIRPRSQMPVSFSDQALQRFSQETGRRQPVTRETLQERSATLRDNTEWWDGKRQRVPHRHARLPARQWRRRRHGPVHRLPQRTGRSVSTPGTRPW